MKVFPGHRARFNTMFEMLKCINIDDSLDYKDTIISSNKQKKRPKTQQNVRQSYNKLADRVLRDSHNIQNKIKDLNVYRTGSNKNLLKRSKNSLNNLSNDKENE